mmetsp:Transcript_79295/g.250496  ORF Transcript_79295/g.250496 Transcript_79295/m.250496 type:complete len:207 (-) Transcript_79295:339-959(-)
MGKRTASNARTAGGRLLRATTTETSKSSKGKPRRRAASSPPASRLSTSTRAGRASPACLRTSAREVHSASKSSVRSPSPAPSFPAAAALNSLRPWPSGPATQRLSRAQDLCSRSGCQSRGWGSTQRPSQPRHWSSAAVRERKKGAPAPTSTYMRGASGRGAKSRCQRYQSWCHWPCPAVSSGRQASRSALGGHGGRRMKLGQSIST